MVGNRALAARRRPFPRPDFVRPSGFGPPFPSAVVRRLGFARLDESASARSLGASCPRGAVAGDVSHAPGGGRAGAGAIRPGDAASVCRGRRGTGVAALGGVSGPPVLAYRGGAAVLRRRGLLDEAQRAVG